MSEKQKNQSIVLHLIVVGFHHKKGCLVEYCYPPLNKQKTTVKTVSETSVDTDSDNQSQTTGDNKSTTDETIVLPEIWKTLPSLALPDGSHNHERDAIYFHLPDIDDHNLTIYGVSCYRQISANKLIARTSDVTRSTVQKSVVVLSRLPLYGLIEAKLEMITHAYFRELDFSKVSLLEETYHNLNAQLNTGLMQSSELFVGLTPRQLVFTFHHKILVLFKLLLLERRVLFYKSPVKDLCVSILSLCSLMPGLIQKGLTSCSVSVHPKTERQFSSDVELSPNAFNSSDEFFVLTTGHNGSKIKITTDDCVDGVIAEEVDKCYTKVKNISDFEDNKPIDVKTDSDDDLLKEIDEVLSDKSSNVSAKSSPVSEAAQSRSRFYDTTDPLPERVDNISETSVERTETPPILKLSDEECGLPLEIFSCGAYLHPYLSLTYLDVLTDVRVRSCLVGATNFLFKQKKDLFDVIVELDSGRVDILDIELKKQLILTTEDLRFADFLVKNVINDSDINGENADIFNDGTGWEGSDEWIRYQFKIYLIHMLRSSEMDENSRDYMSFNQNFMTVWRSTHNYKIWSSVSHPAVFEVTSGHPFGGQLSVNDMKLKLSQIFYSRSEQNKKINQTVTRTSKAVGGAVTTAKTAISSAVTSFWNSWSTVGKPAEPLPQTNQNQKNRPEAETQL